jgi:glycosyltransferase involved in cell wall biosynthesis
MTTPGDSGGTHMPGRLGITAVIPCLDEAAGVARAYAEVAAQLERYDAELLFVDDGSRDATLERIKEIAARDSRVSYISFTRNFGLEAAIGAGFRYASKPWSVQLDADLQFPPSQIHALVARAKRGDCDVVFGIRRERQDSLLRRAASRAQHVIARRVLGIEIPDGASSFRVVRTSVARRIAALRLGTPYFIAAVPAVGARYASVEIAHAARHDGSSRFGLRRLVSHALDLFFGFSLRPFALLPWAAAIAALLTTLAAVAGWAGPVAILTAQALGLAGLAVLGRYVMGLVRQAAPIRYLVREANIAIAPEDLLYEDACAGAAIAVAA